MGKETFAIKQIESSTKAIHEFMEKLKTKN
jgi:hypothetical protein